MKLAPFVLVGDERIPYSQEALDLCGIKCGQRVNSMKVLRRLSRAEWAGTLARQAIYRAHMRALGASLL